MLLIKTELKKTLHKGLGIFAVTDIAPGELVYIDEPLFTKTISKVEFDKLGETRKSFVKKYASYNKDIDSYYLCIDDARFWNHSFDPNTTYDKHTGSVSANRLIKAGEELTTNYTEFCDECAEGDFGFEIK